MQKTPHRATNEITQQYNDGVLKIYGVTNVAPPGLLPKEGLAYKGTLRYSEMRLGLTRYYSAKQNQIEVKRVARTPYRDEVSTQDVAVTEDGNQYRIDLKQLVQNVFPRSMDLTLATIKQKYEVPL